MDKEFCRECKEYVQHYGIFDGKIRKVYCGHCKQIRSKAKRPDDVACPSFVSGTPEDEKLVSREFLTKELLKRVLEMNLWSDVTE